mgnify:CR=1 FL=1
MARMTSNPLYNGCHPIRHHSDALVVTREDLHISWRFGYFAV